ncbi:XRE family transcriptional regulator [Pseudoalteromonas piscicida]|uniref:XRE family transcriptional regulator n=1 Tax=Pseudoalteromonas piscicida TaxID=43662 RepID=A0AAQ2IRQ7_PSEO7|nr:MULTISPECIES: helix-turn-helix transcriptional regulator [Pseudoalteromonas]KJY88262.1 transcriptional regulator [Pseudoalteromonas piscicida]TMN39776.1 XRE family transcriptional regulator [Pseudoalteromonas piscicida]TMN42988.1 XRE family transcriptional regulator [Pseudoalteromonas piscicida]TMN53482.1 XRE family transcriptional regulator [Pseudoalteromonas piscicida]TMN56408.1 XRE family transcriptional regulator [Pseudoalteromonas piscicida]
MESPTPSRLREARKAAGYTQQQLGIALGMEPNTASARMNQYEKGKHAPDFTTMKRIADELGVPVAYFYCEDTTLAELIRVLGKFTKEERKELLSTLGAKKD